MSKLLCTGHDEIDGDAGGDPNVMGCSDDSQDYFVIGREYGSWSLRRHAQAMLPATPVGHRNPYLEIFPISPATGRKKMGRARKQAPTMTASEAAKMPKPSQPASWRAANM